MTGGSVKNSDAAFHGVRHKKWRQSVTAVILAAALFSKASRRMRPLFSPLRKWSVSWPSVHACRPRAPGAKAICVNSTIKMNRSVGILWEWAMLANRAMSKTCAPKAPIRRRCSRLCAKKISWTGRNGQDLSGDRRSRRGAGAGTNRPHHSVSPRRRSGRKSGLSARRSAGKAESLSTSALRRAGGTAFRETAESDDGRRRG